MSSDTTSFSILSPAIKRSISFLVDISALSINLRTIALPLELDQKSEHFAQLTDAPGFVIGVSGALDREPEIDCYAVNR